MNHATDNPSNLPSKSELRQHLRAKRVAYSRRDEASRRILARLGEQLRFQNAASVGWYIDAGSEVTTRASLQHKLTAKVGHHAVPSCVDGDLVFHLVHSWTDLHPGQFGILAPNDSIRDDPSRGVDPKRLEVVLVPGVGFDRRGNRLGQGKGFYDRFLASLSDNTLKVGLAFDCQVVDEVPCDPHDQPMDWIVTESELMKVGRWR